MSVTSNAASRGTVLVVDDNPDNLRVLSAMLSSAGFKPRQALDGEAALRAARASPPDLVLLDIRMPGLDGYQVCRNLKAEPLTCDIPVIFISALNEVTDKVSAFDAGGVDYITKPFQSEEVLARVSSHIELHRLRTALEQRVEERTRELAEANEALSESEARYRSLIDQASDAVYVVDGQGQVVEGNRRASEILGYSHNELTSLNLENIDTTLTGERRNTILSRLRQDGFRVLESAHRRKDGSLVPVEISIGVIEDQNPPLYMALARDITERKERYRLAERLQAALVHTIEAIATIIEKRDPYTAGHQRRTTRLAVAIATEMGLPVSLVDGIRLGGLIHDIGKISIPAEILTRPGRLSDIEFNIIRTHPQAGYDIVKDVDFPWPVANIVYQHHERLDGSGYPRGLLADQISLEARVLAVADVAEAIQSHRPYRPALGIEAAIEEIRKGRGRLFEPDAVDACIALLESGRFRFDDREDSAHRHLESDATAQSRQLG